VRRFGLALPLVGAGLLLAGCAFGTTDPATGVTDAGATLNGSVGSSVDGPTTYWFAYGTTGLYGRETPHRTITISDRVSHPVSEPVSGLTPATTYHYVICAQDPTALPSCGLDQSFSTAPAAPALSISAQPALFPAFDPAVSDYVTRCGASPVTLSVAAPPGTTVAVDGYEAQSGTFARDVQLSAGRAFGFSTTTSTGTSTFNVRCLPPDFPAWTYSRPGVPAASFYIATPQGGVTPTGGAAGGYVAIFDRRGVPVWWKRAAGGDAKLLPDGTLAWWTGTSGGTSTPGFEIHRLDGSLVRTWRTVGTDTDIHDFQLLPDGNALMLAYPPRPGTVDLSPYGGPGTNATVLDAQIQEVSPGGSLVWSWNSKDHVPLSETGQRWWGALPQVVTLPDGRKAYDYAHINSIEAVGTTIVASIRHFDAVYAIDRATGNILFKLGGTTRPESLTVLDDVEGAYPFGGQHYARVLQDGTLTLHDNRTLLTGPPRAVRYRIDLNARTAQLLEQVTDPEAATSFCCGSAERLGDGSWLMDWGGTQTITEFGSDGARHFELKFAFPGFSYRVAVITGATPTIGDLRAGMDAMAALEPPADAGPGPSFVLPEANVRGALTTAG
jgi:hypothetical protein